jgi:hypothetical protein
MKYDTVYEIRRNSNDELIGHYSFEDGIMNIFKFKELFNAYEKQEEYTFDQWLDKNNIKVIRLFKDEIYV